jgi:hypothetical protein
MKALLKRMFLPLLFILFSAVYSFSQVGFYAYQGDYQIQPLSPCYIAPNGYSYQNVKYTFWYSQDVNGVIMWTYQWRTCAVLCGTTGPCL